ncbi:MAG: zinc ribbon domain-containing protein [Candidatus Hodarchaeota archaeon]
MAGRKLFLGLAFTISLFFSVGIITDCLPDKSITLGLQGDESQSVFIGYAAAGTVISGSYEAYWGTIEFFLVDSGNYSRWLGGLSYSMHSYRNGKTESFNLSVPYDAKWYAIFHKTSLVDIDFVTYEIFVGFLGFRTLVFTIVGLAMAAVIGVFALLSRMASWPEEAITELIDRDRVPEVTAREVGKLEAPEPSSFFGTACPYCGHGNPRDAEFCIRCGQTLDLTDDVAQY